MNSNTSKKLKNAMDNASSYKQWLEYANELDYLEEKDVWRQIDDSNYYDSALIRKHIKKIEKYRNKKDLLKLESVLTESLYRNLADITNSELYQSAYSGTKNIITEYLDEIEKAMNFICDYDVPEITLQEKLQRFKQAEYVFGKPALMLSGGCSFGIYHLGVVKALWEQKLLPKIISGSSMGAIVASGVCSRTDDELDYFFAHPENIHRKALKILHPKKILSHKFIMDTEQLSEHIRHNVGEYTFLEAFKRSGRILNITVSPTRKRQKPRILNYLTTPNVMITYSSLASCAIPGVFPPVLLKEKNKSGIQIPYLPTEKWIDGSVHSDVPMKRVSRLNNVNMFIVSQSNPHVLPFITHKRKKGVIPFCKHFVSSIIHAHSAEMLELARDLSENTAWRPLFDKAYAIARQTYLGDINIQFPFNLLLYRKIASNPSPKDLNMYVRIGERATWPQINSIYNQTRINYIFENIINKLENRIKKNSD